jgi:hypothetical protein
MSHLDFDASPARTVDEALWTKWLQRGKQDEERRDKESWRIVALVSILALAVIVGAWSMWPAYGAMAAWVPFVGAVAWFVKTVSKHRYFIAAQFAGVAILHNPIFPLIRFEADSAQRLVVLMCAIPFVFALQVSRRSGPVFQNSRVFKTMFVLGLVMASSASAQLPKAADLSSYRQYTLGSSAAVIAEQTKSEPGTLKVLHKRPALIQSLSWRPPYVGWTDKAEPVQQVTFQFYQSELYQVVVTYDRYQTEGMTAADMTQAISTLYGKPVSTARVAAASRDLYSEPEEIVATWEDARYRFDLLVAPSGPSYRLTGVMKKWEKAAAAAIVEGERLDVLDAPRRDAARARENEATRKDKSDKARTVNKPRFKP